MIDAGLDAGMTMAQNKINDKLNDLENQVGAENAQYINIARKASGDLLKAGHKHLKKKINAPVRSQKELVESFSKMVDDALLNEALGKLAAMGLKGLGKAGLKAGKNALKGAKNAAINSAMNGAANAAANASENGFDLGQFAKDVGSSMWDDVKQAGSDLNTTFNPLMHAKHTFVDDKGNFDFSPTRALKKIGGAGLRTADNVFTAGLGQLGYDLATGNLTNDEENAQSDDEQQGAQQNTAQQTNDAEQAALQQQAQAQQEAQAQQQAALQQQAQAQAPQQTQEPQMAADTAQAQQAPTKKVRPAAKPRVRSAANAQQQAQ
jgi:DNA segregation ATPase FtsK/SpoIIIE-like protein